MNFIRRWLTRPVRWLLLAVFGPALLAALLALWLDAPPGKRLIERAAVWATAAGPIRVELSGLGGRLPFAPRFERLRLADGRGVWLEVDDFALDLDPTALLREAAVIRNLSVGRLALARLPELPPREAAANPEPAAPFDPDALPFKRLQVDRLAVSTFKIGESVAGAALTGELLLENIDATAAQARGDLKIFRIGDNKLSGNAQVGFQSMLLTGGVNGDFSDLTSLAALAGQTAEGRATLKILLSPAPDGGQAATAALRATELNVAATAVGDAAADVALTYRSGDGGKLNLESVRLTAAGIGVTASGALAGQEVQATWRLDPLSLRALARFVPALAQIDGTLNAEGDLSGDLAAPQAAVRARLAGLSVPAAAGFGVKPLSLDVDGRWADGRAAVDARAADGDGRLRLSGKATLAGNGKALDARAEGGVDLALLNDYLAATGDTVSGRLTFTAAATGDPAAPRLQADAVMTGGGLHVQALGTELSQIALKAGWDGRRLLLERLSADTPGRGKLSAQGHVETMGSAPLFDLKLSARDALLADIPLATVVADADLTMRGAAQAAKIAGTTVLKKVDIRIPRRLPPGVTTLEVVETGGGRAPAPPFKPGGKPLKTDAGGKPLKSGEETAAAGIALDVAVEAPPRRVRVSGQGFDGEFGGKLTVRGTAAVPDVAGRFSLQRGALSVLGRDFRFTRGLLIFDGGPEIDPRLDVVAETRAGSDTARILVRGSPRRPEIAFESANGLPSDQVVSQILFGKTTDRLSPGQGVELASALASLSGFDGPSSLLTRVRDKLGLDRLDVGTGIDGKMTVEAGRMVADGVFVGLRQTANGPQGRVEVELTDTIRVEAGVGASGAPEVGVGFELDY